ncbi:MAG TPA: sn-glycerol-3-phosphate ABC transporter ATP-binding protein UgpC [Bacillota bacterium]|jgi:multiple sugar transport system ATP-binding protein|nr:sn-glycerol-3-phosphate ABC transporter ATP-binding protein UgpC [Bacillota bacterium]HOL09072.1 sn-glycerol-3-phosphate ABC transporter ATP-binding protein UgpC [Bacillota bacterium]HPO96747.1 sn-glycerol-3-phosphate ABC transporter ATP-binding protein UgpC [Bacillota bacterium]
MARVVFEHVYKRYPGGVVAVNDVNLEIKDKEFIVFVGPSGCGKTTSLRMVAGLEEISEGNLYIGDKIVNNVAPKDRDIAMVFQNYALYPHMDVYNNMAFGLKLRKFPKSEIDRRVKEAAKILGIENFLHRKPKALSGGQRQRVALGRAIVREPQVFLMDEPLSNLDAKLRVQTRAEISKLHNRLQTTFIYVTHDQTEAMTMADRMVVMKDGIIQQVGSPLDVYDNPSNVFVAGFIGTPPMNFLDGVVKEINGSLYVDFEAFKVKIPESRFKNVRQYLNKPIIFGIRPEAILEACNLPNATEEEKINAMVDLTELMGSEINLFLSIGKHTFTATVEAHSTAKDGEIHQVVFDANKIHLFDKETEKSIL